MTKWETWKASGLQAMGTNRLKIYSGFEAAFRILIHKKRFPALLDQLRLGFSLSNSPTFSMTFPDTFTSAVREKNFLRHINRSKFL